MLPLAELMHVSRCTRVELVPWSQAGIGKAYDHARAHERAPRKIGLEEYEQAHYADSIGLMS